MDIQKKIFRIFRIFGKTPNTKRYVVYLLQEAADIRSLEKRFMVKKLFKIYYAQTVIFDLFKTGIPVVVINL